MHPAEHAAHRSVTQSHQVRGWCQGREGHLCLQRSGQADAVSSLGALTDNCSPPSLNDYSLHPSSPNSSSPAQLCSCSELWHREKAHTPGLCLHLPSKMFFIFHPPHFLTTTCIHCIRRPAFICLLNCGQAVLGQLKHTSLSLCIKGRSQSQEKTRRALL